MFRNLLLWQNPRGRLSNTRRREKEEIRTEILDTFDNKIEVSGYSEMERRKIMRRGNLSFEKLLDLEKKERRRLHRLGNTTLGLRNQKKLLDTTNWYRHKEEQSNGEWEEPGEERKRARSIKKTRKQHQDPVAVIFVERSPEGKLITSLREEEQKMRGFEANVFYAQDNLERKFKDNSISTAKYSYLNFLPLNLFH